MKRSKISKALKILGVILLVLAVFFAVINLIPPRKNVEANPFVVATGELPMIVAHRGGGDNNPENTMLAFREAVSTVGVDVLEGDLRLTKDGRLVFSHDAYIDEACNVNGDISPEEVKALCKNKENRHYIRDMTLDELLRYNFGYYFEDENGDRPYKDAADLASLGLQIATAEQFFEEFYAEYPDLLLIVEIKDDSELGYKACDALWDILKNYPDYLDRMVIGTFHEEIEAYLTENYPKLLHSASTDTTFGFVLTQYTGVNLFNGGSFACLHIPVSYDVAGVEVPLNTQSLIDRAHRRNIAVQYYTIKDPDEMRMLIEMGVDAIMTDDPVLLTTVLDEYR